MYASVRLKYRITPAPRTSTGVFLLTNNSKIWGNVLVLLTKCVYLSYFFIFGKEFLSWNVFLDMFFVILALHLL